MLHFWGMTFTFVMAGKQRDIAAYFPKGNAVLFMTLGSGSNGCQNKPAASGITTPFLTCYDHIGVRGG